MTRQLKVRVDLTVVVDLDDYRDAYGQDDPATIRDDVRSAVADAVNSGGVLADGIVSATLAPDRRSSR